MCILTILQPPLKIKKKFFLSVMGTLVGHCLYQPGREPEEV